MNHVNKGTCNELRRHFTLIKVRVHGTSSSYSRWCQIRMQLLSWTALVIQFNSGTPLRSRYHCTSADIIAMRQPRASAFAIIWLRKTSLIGLSISETWLEGSDMKSLCHVDAWKTGLLLLLVSQGASQDSRGPASVLRNDFDRVCDSPSPTSAGIHFSFHILYNHSYPCYTHLSIILLFFFSIVPESLPFLSTTQSLLG